MRDFLYFQFKMVQKPFLLKWEILKLPVAKFAIWPYYELVGFFYHVSIDIVNQFAKSVRRNENHHEISIKVIIFHYLKIYFWLEKSVRGLHNKPFPSVFYRLEMERVMAFLQVKSWTERNFYNNDDHRKHPDSNFYCESEPKVEYRAIF